MSVFDKIKNALFEEEYVEVEEKPKVKSKPKKDKVKKQIKESNKAYENKPIAKKVVLPEKKEDLVEDFDDYEPTEEDFEIVPEREEKSEKKNINTAEFKFPAVDDQEFKDENYYSEPKIVEVVEKETVKIEDNPKLYNRKREESSYHQREEVNLYHSKDYETSIPIHEYGTYEKKEAKPKFKPSPIISPIYGILDKNYKKEEIVPKREVRLTSYTKEHLNVDDVRRKAYGNLADDIAADIDGRNVTNSKVEKENLVAEDDDNLLVDLSRNDEKPSISDVTMGDAEEYFRDLGLEYNIDYKDSSKERATGRRVTEDYNEEKGSKIKDETEDISTNEPAADDNLFDLIDSMYEDEENKE